MRDLRHLFEVIVLPLREGAVSPGKLRRNAVVLLPADSIKMATQNEQCCAGGALKHL
jgi:hypothetical protein